MLGEELHQTLPGFLLVLLTDNGIGVSLPGFNFRTVRTIGPPI
jgi:hypothetical protein